MCTALPSQIDDLDNCPVVWWFPARWSARKLFKDHPHGYLTGNRKKPREKQTEEPYRHQYTHIKLLMTWLSSSYSDVR